MIDLIFVALFQTAAGPAEAAPSPEPAPAEQTAGETAPQAQPETHQRCRREIITGTRLTQRVCTTVQEDERMEDESRDFINRAQSGMPLNSN